MANESLTSIWGGISESGNYSNAFSFSGDPANFRVRLFFRYSGINDLSSASSVGLYAISDNPCDAISYDDWNGFYRKAYTDISGSAFDSSFNIEIDCEFSGDTQEHTLEFFDHAGRPVKLAGESVIRGTYGADGMPVNVLLERRVSQAGIVSASYDPVTKQVVVVTAGPHGFAAGDAISITGFPRGEHSCGINGERYNGTYFIKAVSDTEFAYATRFYDGFSGQTLSYSGLPGAYATKWVVAEYGASYRVMPSLGEALVLWPAHTFKRGDRITLLSGGTVVARDAVIDEPAPNSFVCRSLDMPLGVEIDSIVYAPRTPVSDVPANYTLPPATGSTRKNRSAPRTLATLVNNASRTVNLGTPLKPYACATFDLDHGNAGGYPVDGKLAVGTRKFAAFTFLPGKVITDSVAVNYTFSLTVSGSTEVATNICLSQISDVNWTTGSDAESVYASVSSIPLARQEISTNALTPGDYSCAFGDTTVFGNIVVDGDIAKKWNSGGKPISIAITLDGREDAEIQIEADSIMVYVSGSSEEEQLPMPIKVIPDLVTVGDTVTVYSRNFGSFMKNIDRLRISISGEEDPDRMVRPIMSDGESLKFIMPEGYSGRQTITVMWKDRSSDTWVRASDSANVDVSVPACKVVKLNERMRPGELSRKVSRSASYNRDFGYVGFTEITDENSMIQNLYSCILTRKGERLFNPDFGTTIEERIFSIRDGASPNAILKECFGVIEEYEPRIQLVYDKCGVQDMGPHGIYLVLGVIVPGGSVETVNIPFKNRGRLA